MYGYGYSGYIFSRSTVVASIAYTLVSNGNAFYETESATVFAAGTSWA